jgi:spore coat protein U-like protein
VNKVLLALAMATAACTAGAQTTCRMISTPGIDFGSYDTLSPVPTDSLTTIRVSCEGDGGPQNVALTMALGPGVNGTSVHGRRMRQLGGRLDFLDYGLYREVTRSSAWGQTNSVDTVTQTVSIPNRASQSTLFTIYGRIRPLQDVSAGTYGDSVSITLTP